MAPRNEAQLCPRFARSSTFPDFFDMSSLRARGDLCREKAKDSGGKLGLFPGFREAQF